jgi:predicted transcriptional regulator
MSNLRKVYTRNRSRLEIVAEVLRELRKPAGKTVIMSRCNMGSTQSWEYLSFMESNNLIQTEAAAGRVTYQITEAGREFLGLFDKMFQLLDSPALFEKGRPNAADVMATRDAKCQRQNGLLGQPAEKL